MLTLFCEVIGTISEDPKDAKKRASLTVCTTKGVVKFLGASHTPGQYDAVHSLILVFSQTFSDCIAEDLYLQCFIFCELGLDKPAQTSCPPTTTVSPCQILQFLLLRPSLEGF